jgi:hypothetical protein
VRNIRLTENVGHWHFAHSYVRGNWRRREDTAPIVLTKSSHDLDIIAWLMEKDRPAFVSSFGTLEYFTTAERAAGIDRAMRGLSAAGHVPVQRDEVLPARPGGWPFDVVAPVEAGIAARRRAIETGQYGRCVWRSTTTCATTRP